jgi:CHAT domain-containing protein
MKRFVLRACILVLTFTPGTDGQTPITDTRESQRRQRDQLARRSQEQFDRNLYDQALRSAREVVRLTEALDGSESARMADAVLWLIHMHLYRQEYRDASPLADKVLAIREKASREQPWLVTDARLKQRYVRRYVELTEDEQEQLSRAANDFYDAKQLDKLGRSTAAVERADKALEVRKRVLGYADSVYIEEFVFQGSRRGRIKGEEEAGRKMLEQAVRLQRELKGELHRDHAATLQMLALNQKEKGQLEEAEKLYRRAGEIFRAVLGPEHETSLRSLEMLAGVQRARAEKANKDGDLTAAVKHLDDEAASWRRRYGPEHWQVHDAQVLAREYQFLARASKDQIETVTAAADLFEEAAKLGKSKRYREAIPVMRKALEQMEATVTERHRAALRCRWALADLYEMTGNVAAAEPLYRRCLEMYREELGEGHPLLERQLDDLIKWRQGQINDCLDRNAFPDALRLFGVLRDLTKQRYPGQEWRLKTIDGQIADAKQRGNRTAAERDRLVEAEQWFEESKKLSNSRQWPAALEQVKKALTVYDDLLEETAEDRVEALHALGFLQMSLGDWTHAEATMGKTLDLLKRAVGTMHPRYAYTLQNLADLHNRTGNLARGVALREEASAILRQTLGPSHHQYARSLVNLASAYLFLDRQDKADPLLDEALPILQKSSGPQRADFAQALNTLAGLYGRRQRPELAARLIEEAGTIWKEAGDVVQYAIARDNLGGLWQKLGDLDRAEPLHREAVELFVKHLGERHPTTAVGLSNLAALQHARKQYASAARTQLRALNAARFNFTLVSALRSEQQQIEGFRFFRRNLDQYLEHVLQANLPAEKVWEPVLAWKGLLVRQQYENRLARTAPELERHVAELRTVTARLAALVLAVPPTNQRTEWRARVDRLSEEREQLEQRLLAAIAKEQDGASAAPATPEEVKAVLPPTAALLDFFQYRDRKRGPCLLAFVARRDSPVAQVDFGPVGPISEAIDRWRKTFGATGKEPGNVARELRQVLWQPLTEHLNKVDIVLVSPDGPLGRLPLAALPGKNPDGYLIEDVAVAVVPVPQMLPTLLSARPKPGGPLPSLVLVGDVDFDAPAGKADRASPLAVRPPSTREVLDRAPAGETAIDKGGLLFFPKLDGSSKEMQAVARLYERSFKQKPAHELRGEYATEQRFRASAPGQEYLHLATHGFFAPAALRSAAAWGDDVSDFDSGGGDERFAAARRLTAVHPGLLSGVALAGANRGVGRGQADNALLDDGILTATELAEINLSRARLVVLSACETGLGDAAGGEGLLGLQRALHVAGARSAVTSLWKVPDDATRALMSEFYANLWEREMPPLNALRDAQRAVMTAYDPGRGTVVRGPGGERPIVPAKGDKRLSPFYWAGFVLSGDWR